jgi:hypothetical protein
MKTGATFFIFINPHDIFSKIVNGLKHDVCHLHCRVSGKYSFEYYRSHRVEYNV